MSTGKNFYANLPKKLSEDATTFLQFVQDNNLDMHGVMVEFFGKYWAGFAAWWLKRMGERIDWISFALAPHNAHWFVCWVFGNYPEVYTAVMKALQDAKSQQEKEAQCLSQPTPSL